MPTAANATASSRMIDGVPMRRESTAPSCPPITAPAANAIVIPVNDPKSPRRMWVIVPTLSPVVCVNSPE